MKKALYIFSFNNNDEIDYDWFVGQDYNNYANQTREVCKFMVANDLQKT